ncbi:glycosyltransferase [Nocardia sp. NPDC050406]|uniref:glycosyltransferase n=1 Tax=Nocardia sp. NPDC050406 TaxID=3364318 RepID=UPI00378817D0
MKVAMVSEYASPLAAEGVDAGGQHVHVAELSAALARHGHEVTVYTRRDSTRVPGRVDTAEGYRVVHVPAGPPRPLPKSQLLPYMGDFGTYLHDAWAAETPDLAHAHHWMSGLAAELAARYLGFPVVQTFHSLGIVSQRHRGQADDSPRARVRFERLIAVRASRVVAHSSEEVFELTRMGVPRFRISLVPCGVDVDRFRPEGVTESPQLPHRLVAVGDLLRHKGFEIGIGALRQLPDTELVIAGGGEGPERAAEARRLRRVAAAAGVADRVRFVGRLPRTRIPALLRSANVVIHTPRYEPSGLIPLEAMACGRPVVATAVGGLLDIVVDGVTGRLVASRDPRALADAIRPLLRDPTLCEVWGTAARQRAHTRYHWDHITDDILRTYRQAAPLHTYATATR